MKFLRSLKQQITACNDVKFTSQLSVSQQEDKLLKDRFVRYFPVEIVPGRDLLFRPNKHGVHVTFIDQQQPEMPLMQVFCGIDSFDILFGPE